MLYTHTSTYTLARSLSLSFSLPTQVGQPDYFKEGDIAGKKVTDLWSSTATQIKGSWHFGAAQTVPLNHKEEGQEQDLKNQKQH